MRVLVTCPPMIGRIDKFKKLFNDKNIKVIVPENMKQTLSVEELTSLLPEFDGWIIGDDPASREVFEAGKNGELKAAVKWGVGVDNVDFEAAKEFGIPIVNTPNMFGGEVADIAVSYVIALARETFYIDRAIRDGNWPKPCGISLAGKKVALIGCGDIGNNTAKRLLAFDMEITVYDPFVNAEDLRTGLHTANWPDGLNDADFIVLTCSLTSQNKHMINNEILEKVKHGVRIVNVSRGALIDEQALIKALESGKVHSAALDVFEEEPLPMDSQLRKFDRCIFGSHNGSNTIDAVERTSRLAIQLLFDFLKV